MALARQTTPKQTASARGVSGLLKLPVELQEFVFIDVFSSTRVTFGERFRRDEGAWIERGEVVWVRDVTKPRADSFALLHTCRQLRNVARRLWLKHTLFNFDSTLSMLGLLASAPRSILIVQIRHVCVAVNSSVSPATKRSIERRRKKILEERPDQVSSELTLYYGSCSPPSEEDNLPLFHVLELLPDLRLDTLTVLAPDGNDFGLGGLHSLTNMAQLISWSGGWKELRMISSSQRLSCSLSTTDVKGVTWTWPHISLPLLHPSGCKELLLDRDGAESGARLELYLAKRNEYASLSVPGVPPAYSSSCFNSENPSLWEPYELTSPNMTNERVQPWYDVENKRQFVGMQFGLDRAALIIARRGNDARGFRDSPVTAHTKGKDLAFLRKKGWKAFRKRNIDDLFPKADVTVVGFDKYNERTSLRFDHNREEWVIASGP
ncbi:hypothetical protein NA57DRAFT_82344 [Rhizodiscina lignyota]|uniref:Uncharacterized protein n=1 Tax=Rhizodiscina lignyota TaxID=1504668 RepID=A0A9P4M403_9PEZI|nr:hypothetical protein NA57DRAFT_82344 [Rhizodiscina lignyota]